MKRLAAILLAMCMLCMLVSCAVPVSMGSTEELALAEARANYRGAALAVSGECVQSHTGAGGEACSDISISSVLAGEASVGDTIHCTGVSMQAGAEYLLFLSPGANVPHAEDSMSYSLAGEPMLLEGGGVDLAGVKVSFNDLKAEMAKVDSVISAPSRCSYYADFASLVEASEEIFFGRVESLGRLSQTVLRKQEGGQIAEYSIPTALATVKAFGSIKGALSYGEEIELVYAPAMSADLVDAATLTAAPYTEADSARLAKGGIFLFFLTSGPDGKQDYYFSINPIQGFVRVNDGIMSVPAQNTALLSFNSMDGLVQGIKRAMQG